MKTKFTITIKDNKKDNTVEFVYNRKDLEPVENKDQKAFLIFVEQLIRGVLDNGFTVKEKKDGTEIQK